MDDIRRNAEFRGTGRPEFFGRHLPRTGPSGFRYCVLFLLVFSFMLVPWSRAQASSSPELKYYIWGEVRHPGAYPLSASPDLVELLSVSGGPTLQANLKRVVLVKAVNQERVRLNVSRLMNDGAVVSLSPGDVVIVPRSGWYVFRDNFWAVTATATLINLGLMIYSLTGN